MTLIERSALLPHSAEQIFDLVADIERYPEFLEGCVGAHILERTEHSVTATLRLSKGGISHGFTTQNTLKRPECMELKLIEGPFEAFSGHWVFRPLGEGAWRLRLQYKPFIRLVWLGCLLMALGGTIAALDRRYRQRADEKAPATTGAEAVS